MVTCPGGNNGERRQGVYLKRPSGYPFSSFSFFPQELLKMQSPCLKRRPALWLLAAVAVLALVLQASPAPAQKKIHTVEGISEYHLDNGLRLLLLPDATSANVTVNM